MSVTAWIDAGRETDNPGTLTPTVMMILIIPAVNSSCEQGLLSLWPGLAAAYWGGGTGHQTG